LRPQLLLALLWLLFTLALDGRQGSCGSSVDLLAEHALALGHLQHSVDVFG
jgi:hypothetical protein